jgi:hypothetical protein
MSQIDIGFTGLPATINSALRVINQAKPVSQTRLAALNRELCEISISLQETKLVTIAWTWKPSQLFKAIYHSEPDKNHFLFPSWS